MMWREPVHIQGSHCGHPARRAAALKLTSAPVLKTQRSRAPPMYRQAVRIAVVREASAGAGRDVQPAEEGLRHDDLVERVGPRSPRSWSRSRPTGSSPSR
jgi:hypothetical protein